MTNAPDYTFFGAGHGISRPRQANSERGAAQEAQAAATKMRGAGVVRHSLVNTQSGRAPQSHARVAGQVNVQRGRLHCYLEHPVRVGWHC